MRKKQKALFISALIVLQSLSYAGYLSYQTIAGGTQVYFTQIQASDRAQYAVNDIIQGQNIDLTNYKNINKDSLNKNQILTNLGSLGRATIMNNTAATVNLKLRVRLSTDREGDLVEFQTDSSVYKITVPPHGGTAVFDNVDLNDLNQSWVNYNVSDLSASSYAKQLASNSKLEGLAADAIIQFTQSGGEILPNRTYTSVVTLVDAGNGTEYHQVRASIFQPATTGKTQLILPGSGEQISASNLYPKFIWMTDVRTGVNLSFTFTLYDYKEGDSVENAIRTVPKYKVENLSQSSLDYPFSAPSLELGKKYAWMIRAFDGTGRFVGGNYSWFQYQVARPPQLSAPQGEIIGFPLVFSYTGVEGADRYEIYISTKKEFTEYKKVETDGVAYSLDNVDTYFEPGKTCYWKVQAIGKNGDKLAKESDVFQFNYKREIELIRPIDTTVMMLPPQFQWTALPGASSYKLMIAAHPDFLSSKTGETDQTSFQPDDSGEFFALDGVYYWKVQAYNKSGYKYGLESVKGSFKTPERGVPMLMSPLGDELSPLNPIHFSWQNMNWVKKYKVLIASNIDFKDAKEFGSESSPLVLKNDDDFLKWGMTYYWRVVPYDEHDKHFNKKSDVGSFRTPGRKGSELISPLGEEVANMQSILFNWEKVPWASKYQLFISDQQDMRNAKVVDAFPPFSFQSFGVIKPGKVYYWQVIPLDELGKNHDQKSGIGTFRTRPVPGITLISPAGEFYAAVQNILVKWTALEGVAGYQVLVSEEDRGMKDAKIYSVEGTMFSIAADSLAEGKKYFVKVNAYDKDQVLYGLGSPIGMFYIGQKDQVNPSVIIYPIEKANELNPILRWNGPIAADYYVLNISEKDLGAIEQKVKGKEIELVKLMTAKPGAAYKWQVQAYGKDATKLGDASKEVIFTLPIPQVKLLGPLHVSLPVLKVKFFWKGESYMDQYSLIIGKGDHLENPKTYSSKEQTFEVVLENGKYSWQVIGLHRGEELAKSAEIGKFEVAKAIQQNKVLLLEPLNTLVSDVKVVLKWQAVEGADEYLVKLGRGAKMDDPREFKAKEKFLEIADLIDGTYNWSVRALKVGKSLSDPSSIGVFQFQVRQVSTENTRVTDNAVVTKDQQPTFMEASPQDLQAFGVFVKEFLKTNGAGSHLEGMGLDELTFDGQKDKINKWVLDSLMNGSTEIKYIKVR